MALRACLTAAAVCLASGDKVHYGVRVHREGGASGAFRVALETSDRPVSGPNAAYGWYKRDTINTTGWAELNVHTNTSFQDSESAYASGYLEGAASATEIQQWCINAHGAATPYSPTLAAWVANNTAYARTQIAANPSDSFWYQTGLTYSQFDGLYDGYAATIPASERFSKEVIYALTLVGDLDDLCPAFGCAGQLGQHKCTSKSECESVASARTATDYKLQRNDNGHCSILIKPLGYVGAPTDIVFGHTTWDPLTIMGPRIMKRYDFPFRTSASDPSPVPGRSITFTSYPAVLYSFDDWYTISSGLTVSETTIINNNAALWSLVSPSSILIWSRAMVANRLAASGQEWAQVIAREQSGTYNNAWHIVAFNTWQPGQSIPDGFFWQVELMPGMLSAQDLTPVLRAQTYWASYNRVFDPAMFTYSGQWELVQQYGAHFTWDQTSRSQIFRRNQSMVTDLASYASLLRYNNFQSDPLSGQGCSGGVHSASNAISERGDLTPATGCTDPGTGRQNEGGIDCKYTSWQLLNSAKGSTPYTRMMAQAGPTAYQQPVFQWSTSPFADYAHLGQPDSWDFPWVDFDAQWDE